MRAYRFFTKVSETGIIQIPYSPNLFNEEVEIIILPKSLKSGKKMQASEFINKWAGFLSNDDTDKSKFDYLSEKYK